MATRKPKSGAKKKPAAKASKKPKPKPEKPECFADASKLDPADPDCLGCEQFDACSDEVSLSTVPEPEPEEKPDAKPEPASGAITTDALPPKPSAPRRSRPPVDPMASAVPPENGAIVMLLKVASDSPSGGQKFVRNKPVTVYDQRLISLLKGNPRYSVVTKK